MKEFLDRLKAVTGATGVDLAASMGLSRQRIYQLKYAKRPSTKRRCAQGLQAYLSAQMEIETKQFQRKMNELRQLSEDIRSHVNGEEDQAYTSR